MTLSTLTTTLSQIGHMLHLSAATGASEALVIIGLGIVAALFVGFLILGAVRAFRAIPSMTTKQFLFFMALLGVALVVIGILLP